MEGRGENADGQYVLTIYETEPCENADMRGLLTRNTVVAC